MTDVADILRQVRRIEVRTTRLVSALTAGAFRSAFRGQGMEFEEVREYSVGDDVRAIDWNVTARAGKPYVKVFREERELQLMLLVDVSGSMRFGAIPGISPRAKQALAAEAAAVVGVTASRNNDRLGLVLFEAHTALHVPVRKGRGHCLRIVREVLAAPTAGAGTDPAHALDELARVMPRRGVVFLVSDFLWDEDRNRSFAAALARVGKRHDIVGLRIADPAEATLPATGAPLVLRDPEGEGEIVISTSAANRAEYARAWATQRTRIAEAFRASGCDLVDLGTDQGAFTALDRFFRRRRTQR